MTFHSPDKFIQIEEVTPEGVAITWTQALRFIELDGVSIAYDTARKNSVLQQFSSMLFGLKFPIQILCTTKDYNPQEYIIAKHDQNSEMRSNLPAQFQDHYEQSFTDTSRGYGFRERKYYIVVGTYNAPTGLIKRDASSYFVKPPRVKIAKEHINRLNSRVEWLKGMLEKCNLWPKLLGKEEVLNLYHTLFNPASTKPPFSSPIAVTSAQQRATILEQSDIRKRNPTEIADGIKQFIKKLDDDMPMTDLLNKANEEALKTTPLEYSTNLLKAFITGGSFKAPMRGSGLLQGDADTIAPEYLEEYPLHIEHQDGIFTGVSISQLPDELSEGWIDALYDLSATTYISLHIAPVEKVRAMKALNKEIKVFDTRIKQYQDARKPIPNEILRKSTQAQEFFNLIAGDKEVFLYTSLYVGFHTANEEERNSVLNELDGILSDKRAGFEKPFTLQMEALRSIYPFAEDEIRAKRNITAVGASMLFPFSPRISDSGKWFFIGRNFEHGGPFFFDQFNTTTVTNANIYIQGISGWGKTVTMQTLATRMLDYWYGVNFIDLMGNFKELTKRYKGEHVSFGEGAENGHINFFQLLPGESVNDKLSACQGLFNILIDDLNQEKWVLLEDAIKVAMNKCIDMGKHAHMKDILDEISRRYEGIVSKATDSGYIDSDAQIYKQIKNILGSFVNGTGAWLFEHDTNIDPSKPLVSFDISGLNSGGGGGDNMMLSLGAYIVLTYLYSNITFGGKQFVQVGIDEVWILLKYPAAAKFVQHMAKTIRNKGCGLMVATQNVEDMMNNEYGKGVISNCQTKFLLKHAPEGLRALKIVMGEEFNLSPEISSYITSCQGNAEWVTMLAVVGTRQVPVQLITLTNEIPREYALNIEVVDRSARNAAK